MIYIIATAFIIASAILLCALLYLKTEIENNHYLITELKEAQSEIDNLKNEASLLRKVNEEYFTKIKSLLSPYKVNDNGLIKRSTL